MMVLFFQKYHFGTVSKGEGKGGLHSSIFVFDQNKADS